MREYLIFIGSLLLVCVTCFISSAELNPKINHTFTLYIDTHFSSREVELIKVSASLWEKSTDNLISFKFKKRETSFVPDKFFLPDNEIIKVDGEDLHFKLSELLLTGSEILGFAMPGKNIILVPNRMESEEEFILTTAHEIGHHIGLEHTKSLMLATPISKSICVSPIDLLMFCERFDCYYKDMVPSCIEAYDPAR